MRGLTRFVLIALLVATTAEVTGLIGVVAVAHDLERHAGADPQSGEATYLGNEGVMVSNGDVKILFDAFYANGYGQYALVPDPIVEDMLSGSPPFDGVDAIFVSHVHGDHFTASSAIAYLRAQPNVRLYGPTQVIDAFRSAGVTEPDPIYQRLIAIDLAPEDPARTLENSSLGIEVIAIPHAGNRPNIQNFVWRVTLDGQTTVIHLGDADPNPAHFSRHRTHFEQRSHHAAFPPYWFLSEESGRLIMSEIIRAEQTIGIHVPAEAIGQGPVWRQRLGGDLFTDPGEKRTIRAGQEAKLEAKIEAKSGGVEATSFEQKELLDQ